MRKFFLPYFSEKKCKQNSLTWVTFAKNEALNQPGGGRRITSNLGASRK